MSLFDKKNFKGTSILQLLDPPPKFAKDELFLADRFNVRGETFGQYKDMYLFMVRDWIHVFRDKEKSDYAGSLEMTYCRNEWFKDECANPRIGIKFLMNDLQEDFLTKDKDVFRKWKPLLCKFCVQTNFHTKYKSLGKLGEGKFASVYKGKSLENNSKIAIKQFSKSEYKKSSEMAILMGEIEALRAVNHPNL